MPKLKQEYEPLLIEIKGRKAAMNLTNADIAKRMRVTERTVQYRLAEPIKHWDLGFLLSICKALEVPIDTLRGGITYQ